MVRYYLNIFFLAISLSCFSQKPHSVEEIAFYHLDSLIKLEPALQNGFDYYANGYLDKQLTSCPDTVFGELGLRVKRSLKNRFNNCPVDSSYKTNYISIPKNKRGKKSNHPLNIYRHVECNNRIYIEFSINYNGGVSVVILELNKQGDLISFEHAILCF